MNASRPRKSRCLCIAITSLHSRYPSNSIATLLLSEIEMGPDSLEDFVTEIAACTTPDAIFAAYRREVMTEGFQNIMFVRFLPSGEHEVPFFDLPEDFARTYLGENFLEADPVLLSLQTHARPFTWLEMMRDQYWDKRYREVFWACSELGAKNGMTIPFHLPNGRCDFFSLSFREKRVIDPRRIAIINMKTYATWQRFTEIDAIRQSLTFATDVNAPGRPMGMQAGSHHNHDTGIQISADECFAIVATDIAHKRYKAGFTEFSATLPMLLGRKLIAALLRRGLIYEEPDDDNWLFVYRPSPLARPHLNSCPAVPYHRENVCSHHVRRDERPVCN